jgi:lipopolysaccharide biosynthesis glycosyltransferase
MNLIYICVFHQQSYINLLKLLITSISTKANINNKTTNILIITSESFRLLIQKELEDFDLVLYYYILDLESLFDAGCARLNIFKYTNIKNYDKILYLDTDILLNSDINVLFNLELSSKKIYALEEGNISHDYWGGQFFDFTKTNNNISGFTSGVLFFKNNICIQELFNSIQLHIEDHVKSNKPIPTCLDQPFIVYNTISQNKYDNQLMILYVENNPSYINSNKIIYHFPGGPGAYESKISKMTAFWNQINQTN